MSPKKQRIAIIEALGWSKSSGFMEYDGGKLPWTMWNRKGQEVGDDEIPDYLNDLNAIHNDVEPLILKSTKPYSSRVQDHEPWRYQTHLRKIVGAELREERVLSGTKDEDGVEIVLITYVYASYAESLKVIRATASQKAEAILKTLNKWEET